MYVCVSVIVSKLCVDMWVAMWMHAYNCVSVCVYIRSYECVYVSQWLCLHDVWIHDSPCDYLCECLCISKCVYMCKSRRFFCTYLWLDLIVSLCLYVAVLCEGICDCRSCLTVLLCYCATVLLCYWGGDYWGDEYVWNHLCLCDYGFARCSRPANVVLCDWLGTCVLEGTFAVWAVFRLNQLSTMGPSKAVLCAVLSMGKCI